MFNNKSPLQTFETDVVVIGYGGAGGIAAITAFDNGCDVVVLEKMSEGGGTTKTAGGNCVVPYNKDFVPYLKTLFYGMTPDDVIEAWVDEMFTYGDWLREMGSDIQPLAIKPMFDKGASFKWIEGSQHMDKWNVAPHPDDNPNMPSGEKLWALIERNIKKRGIRVFYNTPAFELIQNEAGEITGVMAQQGSQKMRFNARKGVVLTCGGFEANEEMVWDYCLVKPMTNMGNPGNTGDGLVMASRVGAALWHMSNSINASTLCIKIPEYPSSGPLLFRDHAFVYVDQKGRRFFDERGTEGHAYAFPVDHFDFKEMNFDRNPCYAIFDDAMMNAGPIIPNFAGYLKWQYHWSNDNQEELKKGWIIKADTLEELAEKIGVDPTNLEESVANYNQHAEEGTPDEFGRNPEKMSPLGAGPYYAIEAVLGMMNTVGGPKRDAMGRVIDWYGKPIPRLYSAGELGSVIGLIYQGGLCYAELFCFGRISGRNVAKETPLKF